jgi:ABC-2 type transport system ATP-binding protein
MGESMVNTVVVKNLCKQFYQVIAVKNMSFQLGKGQILGIVGPNGAGKTTLINLLAGIYAPDAGTIAYFGSPYNTDSVSIKERLGVLPDKLGLFEELKGEEYLNIVSRIYGQSKQETKKFSDELFNFMDMEEEKAKCIYQYSRGMKKKLALSAVLIHSPDLMILDEPYESIDPIVINNINSIIKKLAKNGTTAIITSQILPNIEKICTDILIIDKGKKILQDKISNIHLYMNQEIKKGINPSLEELFINLMKEDTREKKLSWIR